VEWVVREGVGAGGEMTQALYAHMNNKKKKKRKYRWLQAMWLRHCCGSLGLHQASSVTEGNV
jgi:hypothetical protein